MAASIIGFINNYDINNIDILNYIFLLANQFRGSEGGAALLLLSGLFWHLLTPFDTLGII